jgi:DNA-directed RNA polymerase specialized sigma24 family protein
METRDRWTSTPGLTERSEDHRTRLHAVAYRPTLLRAVAYRVLASLIEADHAVQEAWLRLSRSVASEIENLAGWMTTMVADGMP